MLVSSSSRSSQRNLGTKCSCLTGNVFLALPGAPLLFQSAAGSTRLYPPGISPSPKPQNQPPCLLSLPSLFVKMTCVCVCVCVCCLACFKSVELRVQGVLPISTLFLFCFVFVLKRNRGSFGFEKQNGSRRGRKPDVQFRVTYLPLISPTSNVLEAEDPRGQDVQMIQEWELGEVSLKIH